MSLRAPGRLLWISFVTKNNTKQDRITASMKSVGIVALMVQKLRCGECWTSIFNSKFRWRKCYGLGCVQCYGTSRHGVRLDEDDQRGLPGCLWTSSSPNNTVDTPDWLSRSRDMNPMENLWVILRCRIHADERQFETTKGLHSAISKAWSEVDKSVIKNLVNSMPEQVSQIINGSGSCTDY
uniref:DDE_3 domain-containing protein n=1 Tax=Heterorhabditis bacteriophora TaxID=37862 RepID=A0A1I7XB86_HETBA